MMHARIRGVLRQRLARVRALAKGPIVIASMFACGPVLSDVPAAQREEVAHLLRFLRDSACTIERNGKRYGGEDAHAHVRKKYDYFRDEIRTTEDFIEYSASRSLLSGRHYVVACDREAPLRTRDWLLRELDEYRRRRGG